MPIHHNKTIHYAMLSPVNIGKDPINHLVFTHESVSRHHLQAYLTSTQEIMIEEPEPSTWGTYINGRRIKKAVLKPGQKVLIGHVQLHSEQLIEQIWKQGKTDRDFSDSYQRQILPQVVKFEKALKRWKQLEEYLPHISLFISVFIGLLVQDNAIKIIALIVAFAIFVPLKSTIKDYFDLQKERLQEAYSHKIVCPHCKSTLMKSDLRALKNIKKCGVCAVTLVRK